MRIQRSAGAWAEVLRRGGKREAHSWNNLVVDGCVEDEVERKFSTELMSRSCPDHPHRALLELLAIVSSSRADYLLSGKKVPLDYFREILRLDAVENLRYRIPTVLDEAGVSDRALMELDEDDLEWLLRSAAVRGVRLGNSLGIVWVTDREAVAEQEIADPLRLLSRLAVPGSTVGRYMILCVYDREAVAGPLVVPRCFDGLGLEHFRVETDCKAPWGTTAPLSSGEEGLPEAVHEQCEIRPTVYRLVRIV